MMTIWQVPRRVQLAALAASAIFCCAHSRANAQAPVAFTDISARAGIGDAMRQAFSVSWVDFNSDGRPDIWLSRHTYDPNYPLPTLFINDGDGTFRDIGGAIWPWSASRLPPCGNVVYDHCIDGHGSSWIDFDNDGDPDLFVPVGDDNGATRNPSLFLVNENGTLVDRAAETGLAYPPQRGRASLWYDWNGDRRLDAYILAVPRNDIAAPSELFENHLSTFAFASAAAGLNDADALAQFAQSADVTGDGRPDLFVHGDSYRSDPVRVYDTSSLPYTDITASFPKTQDVRDAAIVDLDNDLHPDIFLLRNIAGPDTKSYAYKQNNRLAGFLLVAESGEVGFRLKTPGNLTFDVRDCCFDEITPEKVFIGAAGRHPAGFPIALSSSDATAAGIAPHLPGDAEGFYIGYDPTAQTWTVLLSSSPGNSTFKAWVRAETTQPFSRLTRVGANFASPAAYAPVLLMYNAANGRYEDRTVASGLGKPIFASSVAAADFNNDGLVDLFIDGGDPIKKTPNILYLNRGGGKFSPLDNAGGAAGGTFGPHNTSNHLELGSKVAVADFDRDGFVDVLTTNTLWRNLKYVYHAAAPNRLYRNLGNGNHWVELDLIGTHSNRDGIGARVLLTSGGRTQLREQQGGMHAFSQDSQRIHFGLGQETAINSIVVEWPSGIRQALTDLSAVDRAYLIREP